MAMLEPPFNAFDFDPTSRALAEWKFTATAKSSQTSWARFGERLAATKAKPPRKFATKFLAPVGEVTLLAADGGIGKSMISLAWAVTFALGIDFYGIPNSQGPVIFFTAEDDEDECNRRIDAFCKADNLYLRPDTMSLLDANLSIIDVCENPILNAGRFGVGGNFDALSQDISKRGAKLVFIDNATTVFNGDHNDMGEVSGFITELRKVARDNECAIVLLAHVNSDAANRGGTKTYFGSTAWHNRVRSRIFMWIEGKDKESGGIIHFRHEKHSYSKQAPELMFHRNDDGSLRLFTSKQRSEQDEQQINEYAEQLFADIQALYNTTKSYFVQALTGNNSAFHKMSGLFPDRYPINSSKPIHDQFKRAVNKLVSTGKLIETSHFGKNRKPVDTYTPNHLLGR